MFTANRNSAQCGLNVRDKIEVIITSFHINQMENKGYYRFYMSTCSLMTRDEGYSVFYKAAYFIVINTTLITSACFFERDFDTAVIFSMLYSAFFLSLFECTKMYRQKNSSLNLFNYKSLLISATLSIFLCEIVRITLELSQSQGNWRILGEHFISTFIIWYLISFPTICYTYYFFSQYTVKKHIRVAIFGVTECGLETEKALLNEYSNIQLELSFYDDRDLSRSGELAKKIKSPFKGSAQTLIEEARQGNLDEIYIALPMIALQRIRYFLYMMSDSTADTYIVPDFANYSSNISELRRVHNVQTIGILNSPFKGVGSFIKRTEDIIIGSVILAMISILMLMIAIGIKLTSHGPVFFKQDRYGLSGQKIKVWKFRTMKVMENDNTVLQATKNDPRVTSFGSFLRRTSLDELPQFINVIQGSMSIVGPRPHAVAHNEQYRRQVDNYMIRHKVKPGITGLAQIRGFRGETDTLYKMEKRIQCDIEYIKNWSLWLDIKIIFITIFKGFVGKNAY